MYQITKRFMFIVSVMVTILVSFSACDLMPKKEQTIRIENRLLHDIVLTEYSHNQVIKNTFPVSIQSGKRKVLNSDDTFCGAKIVFSYDNNFYEMEIPYTGELLRERYDVNAYFLESDDNEYGFVTYVQTGVPNPIFIKLLSDEGGHE